MSVCNESKLIYDENKKTVTKSGLPTEAALKVLNEKIGRFTESSKSPLKDDSNIEKYNTFIATGLTRTANLEFTSKRKCMSVLMKD